MNEKQETADGSGCIFGCTLAAFAPIFLLLSFCTYDKWRASGALLREFPEFDLQRSDVFAYDQCDSMFGGESFIIETKSNEVSVDDLLRNGWKMGKGRMWDGDGGNAVDCTNVRARLNGKRIIDMLNEDDLVFYGNAKGTYIPKYGIIIGGVEPH